SINLVLWVDKPSFINYETIINKGLQLI
ncbi:hypothetical protein F911_03764, partial [Acinetobacter baumannii ATCC 19606 = CIP 70.34 = JCM 6841]